jgi:ABC-type uncharacterized transport system ATPase subunit
MWLNEVSMSIPRGSIYGLWSKRSWKTSLIRIINQITLIAVKLFWMVKKQTRSIHRLFTRRKRIVHHESGRTMLVFGKMKGLKAEAKKQLEYWFERLIQGWNKNPRAF